MQDVLIDDKYVDKIEVLAVDSLDEVMEQVSIQLTKSRTRRAPRFSYRQVNS